MNIGSYQNNNNEEMEFKAVYIKCNMNLTNDLVKH